MIKVVEVLSTTLVNTYFRRALVGNKLISENIGTNMWLGSKHPFSNSHYTMQCFFILITRITVSQNKDAHIHNSLPD